MSTGRKLRVAVIFGGRSGEHEISLQSAASVIRHLDPTRFEVVPVAIDKDGRWLLNDLSLIETAKKSLTIFKDQPSVVLQPAPSSEGGALIPIGNPRAPRMIDVVFPVMHGPLCEDGSIQGLFELADVPYVGCGVLASAVGMDKEVAKRLARDRGIRIVPYVSLKKEMWKRDQNAASRQVEKEIGFPCFVKPVNLGSSVGVHKVKKAADLKAALEDAFQYDLKVLVEKAINAREIELSALENPDPGLPPLVSLPGEVIPTHEFYSYESKYLDENGAALKIPADLTPAQVSEVQKMGREVFEALECEGMARVDFFMDKTSGEIYFNEINTIPGFTSISMYPKMWEASGIKYMELLSKLIDLAMARHKCKKALVMDFHAK